MYQSSLDLTNRASRDCRRRPPAVCPRRAPETPSLGCSTLHGGREKDVFRARRGLLTKPRDSRLPTSLCLVIIIIITPAAVLASFAAVALVAVTLYIVFAQVAFGQTAAPAVWRSAAFPGRRAAQVLLAQPVGTPSECRSSGLGRLKGARASAATGKEADTQNKFLVSRSPAA